MLLAIDGVASGSGAVLMAAGASLLRQVTASVDDAMPQPCWDGRGAVQVGRLLPGRAAVRGRCPVVKCVFSEFGCQP